MESNITAFSDSTTSLLGVRGFQEVEWLFGTTKIVLGGELVEVIPQADHLRRIARRENFRVRKLDFVTSRLRAYEHVAGMHNDRIALKHAKSCLSIILESDPLSHVIAPRIPAVGLWI